MPDRTRQAILDAAAATLPTNSGASLADVAAAAGVGRTTVHRHFPTRETLLTGVAVAAIDRIDDVITGCRLEEGPAPDVLRRLADALVPLAHEFRFLDVGPEIWRLGGELSRRWYRVVDRLEALVERGKREGDLRPDIPTPWLVDLLSAAVGCAGESIDDGRVAQAEAPRLLVEVLLRGAGR